MQYSDIVHQIENVREHETFGVVTPDAVQKQLGNLTPSDWQNAAVIYHKDVTKDDGFYITDTPDNKVTIHNDTSKALDIATTSTFKLALNDAGNTVENAIGDTLLVTGTSTILGIACLSAPALAAAALAINVGFDVVHNERLKNKAADEFRHDQTVSFTPAAKTR